MDILNCAEGCNLGTGALCKDEDSLAVSRTMYQVAGEANTRGRSRKAKFPGMRLADFDKSLKLDDFIRPYSNKFAPLINVAPANLEQAFQSLHKNTPAERHINCCSCGFETCEAMAMAIAKNINHPENCVEFHKTILRQRSQEIEEMLSRRELTAGTLKENAERIFSSVQSSSVQSSQAAEKIESINEELNAVEEVAMRLSQVVEDLAGQIDKYEAMGSKVVSISTQTRLLSMNAAVEAAHAGAAGKCFAVVADEMKELSDKSGRSAKEMLGSNQTVFPILEEVRSFSQVLNEKTQSIASSTREMQQAVQTINETEQHIEAAAAQIVQD